MYDHNLKWSRFFFSSFLCWRKKVKQSHNGPVVPVSVVVISSLLISSVFKQFEIIVTFYPTKTKDKHPMRTTIIRKAKPVLHYAIHYCIQFNSRFYRIFRDFPSLYKYIFYIYFSFIFMKKNKH